MHTVDSSGDHLPGTRRYDGAELSLSYLSHGLGAYMGGPVVVGNSETVVRDRACQRNSEP